MNYLLEGVAAPRAVSVSDTLGGLCCVKWKTKKHGADYRRQWRKVHLGIDASTLEIRAMEVTDNNIGDAPVLPALLSQIPADERIGSVSGDGAYDTKDCHEAIALRAAHTVIGSLAVQPGNRIRVKSSLIWRDFGAKIPGSSSPTWQ